jgi:hypothetical protein
MRDVWAKSLPKGDVNERYSSSASHLVCRHNTRNFGNSYIGKVCQAVDFERDKTDIHSDLVLGLSGMYHVGE